MHRPCTSHLGLVTTAHGITTQYNPLTLRPIVLCSPLVRTIRAVPLDRNANVRARSTTRSLRCCCAPTTAANMEVRTTPPLFSWAHAPCGVVHQVTKHNFEATLPAIQHALDECLFFTFDCEFTGLHVDDARYQFLDTMEERYQQVRHAVRCTTSYVVNTRNVQRMIPL